VKYAEWRGGGAFEVVFSNLSPQQREHPDRVGYDEAVPVLPVRDVLGQDV